MRDDKIKNLKLYSDIDNKPLEWNGATCLCVIVPPNKNLQVFQQCIIREKILLVFITISYPSTMTFLSRIHYIDYGSLPLECSGITDTVQYL